MPITKKPTLIKTFSSGLNHQTHLISSNDKKSVLKLFSKPSPSAIAIQKFAANYHLAPDILYTNQTDDVTLMEHVDSDTLPSSINSQDLALLGDSLKQIHSLPTMLVSKQTGDFDLLGYYETYLTQIGPNDALTRSIHNEVLPTIKFFLQDKTSWCVCHNDLVKENCFITETGVQFVDWEYAQLNNPWFDIATVIYTLDLDQIHINHLIQAYDSDWLEKVNTPIYFATLISMLWCDILWHLAKAQNAELLDLKKKLSDLKKYKQQFDRLAS